MKFTRTVKGSKFIKLEIKQSGKTVARGFLYLIKNDLHKKPYGLMEDVFVSQSLRGKGLGSELIRQLIEEAKKQKCYKLIATSRILRPKVHKFYRRFGFKKYGVEFRLDLSE